MGNHEKEDERRMGNHENEEERRMKRQVARKGASQGGLLGLEKGLYLAISASAARYCSSFCFGQDASPPLSPLL